MTDKITDKKTESINALKNANKHLSDLFADVNKKDIAMKSTASDLLLVAKQCGELRIEVWVGNNKQTVFLKTYLEACSKTLEEAR